MASVNDWTAKAAQWINDEIRLPSLGSSRNRKPSEERIAAIIATFAEPLVKLLRESQREHILVEDGVCYKATVDDDEFDDAECTCGADAWNARVDAALAGEKP